MRHLFAGGSLPYGSPAFGRSCTWSVAMRFYRDSATIFPLVPFTDRLQGKFIAFTAE